MVLAVNHESAASALTPWAALLAFCSSLSVVVWDAPYVGADRIAADTNAHALRILT
jgi:hypothetical protein